MLNEEIMQEVETPVEEVKPVIKKNRAVVGVVNCDDLKLRAEADADADVIFLMKKDTAVSIEDTVGDFYKVIVNGVVGYCMKKFITVQ